MISPVRNRLLRLTFLALDVQEAIIEGRQAKGVQLEDLTRAIPAEWEEQRYGWLALPWPFPPSETLAPDVTPAHDTARYDLSCGDVLCSPISRQSQRKDGDKPATPRPCVWPREHGRFFWCWAAN